MCIIEHGGQSIQASWQTVLTPSLIVCKLLLIGTSLSHWLMQHGVSLCIYIPLSNNINNMPFWWLPPLPAHHTLCPCVCLTEMRCEWASRCHARKSLQSWCNRIVPVLLQHRRLHCRTHRLLKKAGGTASRRWSPVTPAVYTGGLQITAHHSPEAWLELLK